MSTCNRAGKICSSPGEALKFDATICQLLGHCIAWEICFFDIKVRPPDFSGERCSTAQCAELYYS